MVYVKKDSEKAYKTYRGRSRNSKQPLVLISCRCSNHCASHVNMAEGEVILFRFYKLGEHDSQNTYLFRMLSHKATKTKAQKGLLEDVTLSITMSASVV